MGTPILQLMTCPDSVITSGGPLKGGQQWSGADSANDTQVHAEKILKPFTLSVPWLNWFTTH